MLGNCASHGHTFAVTDENATSNSDYGFGECEAKFNGGYVLVQWDVSPGFGKSFSLVGLDCAAHTN